jgi:hypothetical protein
VEVAGQVPRPVVRPPGMSRQRRETRAARQKSANRIDYSAGEAASTVVAAAAKALERRGGGDGIPGVHGYQEILAPGNAG